MSTIVVARKGKTACIAADTLTTFGDIRLDSSLDANSSKIQSFGKTLIGIVAAPRTPWLPSGHSVTRTSRQTFPAAMPVLTPYCACTRF